MSEAWTKLDAARALHPADHLAIRSTEPARSLVAELFLAGAERDLWNACARLGRMMADEGASPTLVAGTIDNAAAALGVSDAARIAPARASLLEGYVASVREAERGVAAAAWDYPNCVVKIENDVVAIACGRPTDDRDALTAWAERVASKLSKAKVKRAILEGGEAARAELASALELVGIALVPGQSQGQKKSWLPWKR